MRAFLALVLAAGLAGCTQAEPARPAAPPLAQDGVSVVESGAPCVPEPAVPGPLPPGYPAELALPPGTVVTYTAEQAGTLFVSGRVDADAMTTLQHFRDAAEPAELAVIRDEDEGAGGRLQLFGATTEVGVTVVTLPCPAGAAGFTVSIRRTVS